MITQTAVYTSFMWKGAIKITPIPGLTVPENIEKLEDEVARIMEKEIPPCTIWVSNLDFWWSSLAILATEWILVTTHGHLSTNTTRDHLTKPLSCMEQQTSSAHNAENCNTPKSGILIIMINYWEQTAQQGTSSPVQLIAMLLHQFLTISSGMKIIPPSRSSRYSDTVCDSSSTIATNWNYKTSSPRHGT